MNIKLKNKFKQNKGITLIALVVTIIVLLILAGISISMLAGEGGILINAREASESTKDANEDEQVNLVIQNALSKGMGELTTANLKEAIGEEFGADKKDNLTEVEEGGPWTFKGERKTYTIETNGKVTSGDPTTPPTEEKLAKEVLKIDPNAEEEHKKSPYVKYNGILCRVLYNDEYEERKHGLQIISADNIKKNDIEANGADEEEKVPLGDGSDLEKSKDDYNKAVDTLNNKAKECMSEADKQGGTANKIVIGARSLGSIATLKDGKFQLVDNASMHQFAKELKDIDNNYIEDVDRLNTLDLNATNSDTWLASRYVFGQSGHYAFSVRTVDNTGILDYDPLCTWSLRNDICHERDAMECFSPCFPSII